MFRGCPVEFPVGGALRRRYIDRAGNILPAHNEDQGIRQIFQSHPGKKMIRISCGCRNAEPGRPHHLGERPSIRRKNYAKPGKDQPHGAVHQPGLLFPGHAQFRQKGIRFRSVQFPMTAAGRAIVPDSRGGNHHSRRFMQPVDRFHQLAGGHDAALHQLPLVGIRPAPVDGRSGQIDDGMASRQGLRQTIHALLGKQIAPQGRHPMPEHLKTLGQMTPYKSSGSRNGYIHHLNPNGGPPPGRRSGTSPESPHGTGSLCRIRHFRHSPVFRRGQTLPHSLFRKEFLQ